MNISQSQSYIQGQVTRLERYPLNIVDICNERVAEWFTNPQTALIGVTADELDSLIHTVKGELHPRRRPRVSNDNYAGKIDFWSEQLKLANTGLGLYSVERATSSLLYFQGRREQDLLRHEPPTDTRGIVNMDGTIEKFNGEY